MVHPIIYTMYILFRDFRKWLLKYPKYRLLPRRIARFIRFCTSTSFVSKIPWARRLCIGVKDRLLCSSKSSFEALSLKVLSTMWTRSKKPKNVDFGLSVASRLNADTPPIKTIRFTNSSSRLFIHIKGVNPFRKSRLFPLWHLTRVWRMSRNQIIDGFQHFRFHSDRDFDLRCKGSAFMRKMQILGLGKYWDFTKNDK